VPYHSPLALCLALAAVLCSQSPTDAEATLAMSPPHTPASLVQLARKSVIDKSCLMMCDKWGEHGCLKWVMRCKGDPGYPKAMSTAP
jgi:hypothetical protein